MELEKIGKSKDVGISMWKFKFWELQALVTYRPQEQPSSPPPNPNPEPSGAEKERSGSDFEEDKDNGVR